MRNTILVIFCMTSLQLFAQTVDADLREGNNHYRLQQFDKAETSYQNALLKNGADEKARFNLANTLHKLGKEEEAKKGFTQIALESNDKTRKAAAHYNIGVILSKEKKLEESIEAYKNALRQNPDDAEARENLQKALLELKKKNPPKKEQKKDQQQQKKQQQQPKMSAKEAEQRLKLLEQKEKEVNQRLQKEKSKSGGGQPKDW